MGLTHNFHAKKGGGQKFLRAEKSRGEQKILQWNCFVSGLPLQASPYKCSWTVPYIRDFAIFAFWTNICQPHPNLNSHLVLPRICSEHLAPEHDAFLYYVFVTTWSKDGAVSFYLWSSQGIITSSMYGSHTIHIYWWLSDYYLEKTIDPPSGGPGTSLYWGKLSLRCWAFEWLKWLHKWRRGWHYVLSNGIIAKSLFVFKGYLCFGRRK